MRGEETDATSDDDDDDDYVDVDDGKRVRKDNKKLWLSIYYNRAYLDHKFYALFLFFSA